MKKLGNEHLSSNKFSNDNNIINNSIFLKSYDKGKLSKLLDKTKNYNS